MPPVPPADPVIYPKSTGDIALDALFGLQLWAAAMRKAVGQDFADAFGSIYPAFATPWRKEILIRWNKLTVDEKLKLCFAFVDWMSKAHTDLKKTENLIESTKEMLDMIGIYSPTLDVIAGIIWRTSVWKIQTNAAALEELDAALTSLFNRFGLYLDANQGFAEFLRGQPTGS
jgi:hypothetical protein